MFLGVASVSIQGCVRLNLETRDDCVGLPEALPFEEQTELKYKIKVSRFKYSAGGIGENVAIEAGRVDGIFGHATNVLRCGEGNEDAAECGEVDVQGDFACKVTLERKGSDATIPTFTLPFRPTPSPDLTGVQVDEDLDCTRDGEICSGFDLLETWNADPTEGVKVVNNVKWCNGIREIEVEDFEAGKLGPIWIGCGQLPGRSMAVERINEDIEGILWPHEFGHAKGLYHATGQSCALNDDPQALMSPEIWKTQTKLNGQECFGFRGGQP